MQDAIILYENGKAIGGEGHPTDADDITFDNAGTDIVANKVGSAIKEVNAKSAKSADLTSISETGSTASQAISAGTYFYLDGVLAIAKVNIASGATFTLNTNYEVVGEGALNKLRGEILLAEASGNASYATKLSTLASTYNSLTEAEKLRCYIKRGTRRYFLGDDAQFISMNGGGTTSIQFDVFNLGTSKAFTYVIKTSGVTISEISSSSDSVSLSLYILK